MTKGMPCAGWRKGKIVLKVRETGIRRFILEVNDAYCEEIRRNIGRFAGANYERGDSLR